MNNLPERKAKGDPPLPPEAAALRVSTQEREGITARLQAAFTLGMLDEAELDSRVHAALAAKTRGELYPLVGDLPAAELSEPDGGTRDAGRARRSGRFLTAYGSTVERKGRFRVPPLLRPIIFKGRAIIDLRSAELPTPETRFKVTAYKSTIEIIVPPDLAVDARGFAYKGGWVDEVGEQPSTSARRTLRIRGLAYKSRVIVRRSPSEERQ